MANPFFKNAIKHNVEVDTAGSSGGGKDPTNPAPPAPPAPDPEPPKEEVKPADVEPIKDPEPTVAVPESTHYVKTVNPEHRLALRLSPSFVAVSKEAAIDTDKKGELVVMMPNGTPLTIVEPHVGYHCEWHQVLVLGNNPDLKEAQEIQKTRDVFCYAEFVQPRQNAPKMLAVQCGDCYGKKISKEKKVFPDWPEKDLCSPWYDKETCSYYVAVPTKYERSDKDQLPLQGAEAMATGIEALLSFYDKQRKTGDLKEFLTAFRFAEIYAWNLDERPSSKLKFLIRIPAKYFDAIPENIETWNGVPVEGNEKIPFGWRTVHFSSANIEENLEAVSTLFELYAQDVQNWGGNLADFDFFEEAERLRSFMPVFKQFLLWNDVVFKAEEETSFEIGFSGPCFKLEYVLYGDGNYSSALRIGIECFKIMEPVVFERTMGYLFYHDSIIRESKKKIPWSSFINAYSCPPIVIRPSAAPPPVRREIPSSVRVSEYPIKTEKEKRQEDAVIQSPTLKERLIEVRKTVSLYVGDSLLSCERLPRLLDQITSLEELYSKILNKVSIKDVTGAVAACLIGRLEIPDLRMLACKFVLRQLRIDQLQKLLTLFDQTVMSQIEENLKYAQASKLGQVTKSDAETLRKVIQMSASDEEVCRTLTSFDPSLIEQKMRLLSSFKLPGFVRKISVPTIKLPDNLKTEDLMAEIAGMILDTVYKLLSAVLIELIKSLFRALCDQCKPVNKLPEKHGGVNLNDILRKNAQGLPDGDGLGKKIFDDFGADIDGNTDDEISRLMRDFFDDLSSLLKPSELCELLNGQVSESVLKVVQNLILDKYPKLADMFSVKGRIRALFAYIGKFLPPSVCETIASVYSNQDGPIDLCGFSEEMEARKALLSRKLSPEQVAQQLEELKERNKKRVEQLMDLMEDNLLDGVIPSVGHNPCKPGGSLVPYDPPSVKYLNDRVIEQTFSSLVTIFNQDLTGFVYNLVKDKDSKVGTTNFSEFKRAVNANRKQLEGDKAIDDEDKKVLAKDPLSIGQNMDQVSYLAAPGLKDALVNPKVIYKQDRNYHNSNSYYVMDDYRETGEDVLRVIQKSMADTFRDVVIVAQSAEKPKSQKVDAPPSTCADSGENYSLDSGEAGVYEPDVISTKTVLRYHLRSTEEFKNNDEVVVNKNIAYSPYVFSDHSEIDPSIKDLVSKYTDTKIVVNIKRDVFANFMMSVLKPKLSLQMGSQPYLVPLYEYFRNDVYHRVVVDTLQAVVADVAKSKLFNIEELQKINFLGNAADNGLCPPNSSFSLLSVEDIKKLVHERYQREVNRCSQKESDLAPIERANLEGVVAALVRVYVIEMLLKALFVFSRYKLSEVVEDPLISDYIVWSIEQDLRRLGSEFYDTFLLESKKVVMGRDGKTFAGGEEEKILGDESKSDYQSGLAFLRFLVKQQLASLSPKMEELLFDGGTSFGSKVSLYQRVFCDRVPFVDIPSDASNEDYGYFENGGFKFEKYVRYDGGATRQYQSFAEFFVASNKSGGDVVPGGGSVKVGSSGGGPDKGLGTTFSPFGNENIPESEGMCGTIGLRLVYIPPTAGKFSFQDLWVASGLQVESGAAWTDRAWSLNGGKIHPIVIASVEENGEINSNEPMSVADFNIRALKLKERIYSTENFRLLFDFVFDLKEYLSFSTIYNVNMITRNVKGIESSFDSTKRYLRILFRTLANTEKQDWWKREDDEIEKIGGNEGIFEERMGNIKATGPASFLSAIAARAITIIIKGCAERFDPAYKLLKMLDDAGATIAGLTWPSMIAQIMPINIVPPPIGFGPPVGPYGILALTLELLSGEIKDKQARELEKKANSGGGDGTINTGGNCVEKPD